MTSRPSYIETLFEHARVASLRSTCPAARVGAVIAREDVILAVGYNGAPRRAEHCDVAGCVVVASVLDRDPFDNAWVVTRREYSRHVHAEANVIAHCARLGIACEDARLFVTKAPCLDCVKLAANAGIIGIVVPEVERAVMLPAVMEFAGECGVVVHSVERMGD